MRTNRDESIPNQAHTAAYTESIVFGFNDEGAQDSEAAGILGLR
jgi:hypothetical protein